MINWILAKTKSLIFQTSSQLTTWMLPYKNLKGTSNIDWDYMDEFAKKCEDRLLEVFEYKGFILPELYNTSADGTNHYVSDWCLWNGVFLASRVHKYMLDQHPSHYETIKYFAKQYTDNWIDDEGYIRRGWKWNEDGTRTYKYKISLDQISGFVYGLSQVPMDILRQHCKDKIRLAANRFIEDGYKFKTPDNSDKYETNTKGILVTGLHVAIGASLMWIAYWATNDKKYYDEAKKYDTAANRTNLAVPIGSAFGKIRGFNFNITMLSLVAFYTASQSKHAAKGIKYIWDINRKVYNPWWSFLNMWINKDNTDFTKNAYMLSTFNEKNWSAWELSGVPDTRLANGQQSQLKKFFGNEYYDLPLAYNQKKGDCFMLQSIWRKKKYFGTKVKMQDKKYSMLTFLAPYYVMKLIRQSNFNDQTVI